jgi:hypothetical protein
MIMMSSPTPSEAQPDPLARYRWTARVLVVLAADPESPALAEQRRQIDELEGSAADRDLVIVEPSSGSSELQALGMRFGLGPEPFLAVLVGKDGGAKLHSFKPITARELMTTIDAMPMRQDEIRNRDRSP